jgi:hypothetical protein
MFAAKKQMVICASFVEFKINDDSIPVSVSFRGQNKLRHEIGYQNDSQLNVYPEMGKPNKILTLSCHYKTIESADRKRKTLDLPKNIGMKLSGKEINYVLLFRGILGGMSGFRVLSIYDYAFTFAIKIFFFKYTYHIILSTKQ